MRKVKGHSALLCLVAATSLLAACHEAYELLTISKSEPQGSAITRLLVILGVSMLALHERTRIFDKGILELGTLTCRVVVMMCALSALIIYAFRFGDVPSYEIVHRFAPVNAVMATFFATYVLVSIAGDEFLGPIRKIFRIWR